MLRIPDPDADPDGFDQIARTIQDDREALELVDMWFEEMAVVVDHPSWAGLRWQRAVAARNVLDRLTRQPIR